MCGIIGYTSHQEAGALLLQSLELLEYRGYDSAGIAMTSDYGRIEVTKCTGRVKDLESLLSEKDLLGHSGIGHTRWATHGTVTKMNAHPHQYQNITLVHNGIIENYEALKEKFHLEGTLQSETDSEIVAGVMNHYYEGNPLDAIRKTLKQLQGTYALVMLFEDHPNTIYATRNVSPIVAGTTSQGSMLASDVAALKGHCQKYLVLPEYSILQMSQDAIELYGTDLDRLPLNYLPMDINSGITSKEGYPFFMEKEIMEQPEAFSRAIHGRILDGCPDFTQDKVPDALFQGCNRICVIACGTAMHAGLVGQALSQSLLHIHMDVELASEFLYSDPVVDSETLVIAISQSGETIDTLEALKYAKSLGSRTLSIINVPDSALTRESEYVVYTKAGTEIAVASTKAYTTQLALLYLIMAKIGLVKGILTLAQVQSYTFELTKVPAAMTNIIERKQELHRMASSLLMADNAFMIGRCLDYYGLLEASLKLKEVSYIHSEAYASGELKHGPIALITEETPVVAMVTQDKVRLKEISNIREVQARGAKVLLFIKDSFPLPITNDSLRLFELPALEDLFMPIPSAIAFQLLAYYVSTDKGYDVDKPRNLAKVVTVE